MAAVVSTKLKSIPPHKKRLCPCMWKMLCRWLRILKLWKISAMLMVRNAMVVPSGLLVISQTPASM